MTVRAPAGSDTVRRGLLGLQQNHSARLSPDGRRVAYVHTVDGGPELWLHDGDEHRRIAAHPGDTVDDLRWTPDGTVLLYRHAEHGREHWRLAGVRLSDLGPVSLPGEGSVSEYWLHDTDPAALVYACRPAGSRRTELFVTSSAGGPTRRLLALTADGEPSTVFAHPDLDLESYPAAPDAVWFDPVSGEPDLCTVMDQRLRHHVLAPVPPRAVAHLAAAPGHARLVIDRSADDRTWLVAEVHDDGPMRQYRYHPATDRSDPVVVNRPELAGARLSGLDDLCFTAGDGRRITGYAMRPLDAEPPYPAVVLVHGGPAGRDTWRFHAEAQYLASLGYLSLHVNYRGSRGFGTEFREAGNGEWGGRMQQDLYDAVAHGVADGLVDPDRVAFLGSSYGGYAAMLAACARPDLVRCAVAISPLCDLVSFATAPSRYWRPLSGSLLRQVRRRPDGSTVDDAALAGRSPAHVLTASCAPLLVAHGVLDPRVPVAAVDAFVERAAALDVPVRYLRFPDEGHLVKSDHNRETLFGEVELFLERHDAHTR